MRQEEVSRGQEWKRARKATLALDQDIRAIMQKVQDTVVAKLAG